MVIGGIGLASSLGSLVQAGAAFRAGIDRFQAARDFSVFEPGDDVAQPVVVSPASGSLTVGFVGVGRLVVLAMAALRDLRSNSGGRLPKISRVFMIVPDPVERGMPVAGAELETEDERVAWLGETVLTRALTNLGWSSVPCSSFGGGRDAFIRAAIAAEAQLAGDAQILLLSVDSLLTPECLEILLADGGLRTKANAMGICPGEAAVAVLIAASVQAKAEPVLVLSACAVVDAGEEAEPGTRGVDDSGIRSLEPALLTMTERGQSYLAIVDHAGRVEDANEWGMTVARLQGRGMDTGRLVTWFPAGTFGDVGVVFGGLGVALASRAMPSGRIPTTAFLKLVTDHGRRAGGLLTYGNQKSGGTTP